MKRVALGVLSAFLGAGCAYQTGDPGDPRTGEVASDPATASATPDPGDGALPLATPEDIHRNGNPEPSPWRTVIPSAGAAGPSSAVAGSTQSTTLRTTTATYPTVSR